MLSAAKWEAGPDAGPHCPPALGSRACPHSRAGQNLSADLKFLRGVSVWPSVARVHPASPCITGCSLKPWEQTERLISLPLGQDVLTHISQMKKLGGRSVVTCPRRLVSSDGKPKGLFVLEVCSCDGHVFTEQLILISILIYSWIKGASEDDILNIEKRWLCLILEAQGGSQCVGFPNFLARKDQKLPAIKYNTFWEIITGAELRWPISFLGDRTAPWDTDRTWPVACGVLLLTVSRDSLLSVGWVYWAQLTSLV